MASPGDLGRADGGPASPGPRRRRRRRAALAAAALGALVAIVAAGAAVVTRFSAGTRSCTPAVSRHPAAFAAAEGEVLRVMTLNVAHGRSDGRHQALQRRASIESHLDDVVRVLDRERPHVLALQEGDGPSVWSGGFDHIRHLAEGAGFAQSLRGEHVDGAGICYGTALLSKLPLAAPLSVTFEPTPPTFSKGFVTAAVAWPGTDAEVDVVSVHLDFSRGGVRRRQVADMVDWLKGRRRPLVVMGDFNCDWGSEKSPLRAAAMELDLRAHEPDSGGMATFPTLGTRIDWILVSPGLEFASYRTLADAISDHRGVVADLRVRTRGEAPR